MAAPAITARITPTGTKLDNGHRSTLAFASNASVNLWEKSVQPPGVDGGEPIDTSTQHNQTWVTMRARKLRKVSPISMKVSYDPTVLSDIYALCNVEGAITHHFPSGAQVSFFGYLQSFEPEALEEGKAPEANVKVVVTNWDPSGNVESGPVTGTGSGT